MISQRARLTRCAVASRAVTEADKRGKEALDARVCAFGAGPRWRVCASCVLLALATAHDCSLTEARAKRRARRQLSLGSTWDNSDTLTRGETDPRYVRQRIVKVEPSQGAVAARVGRGLS